MAFTLALSAHAKFPTKIGWWTLLVVMFAPIIWGTFDGLFQTYSLLVAKYSWADFFELMVIDLFVALVAALFLYSSGVAPVTEEGSTNESSGNYA